VVSLNQKRKTHNCPEEYIGCHSCGNIMIKRKLLNTHLKDECSEGIISCERCEEAIKRGNQMNHNQGCREYSIVCQCGVSLRRKDLLNHQNNVCPETWITCSLCACSDRRKNLASHDCPESEVTCICGKNLKRKEVQEHKNKICEDTVINCSLSCTKMLTRKELNDHLQEECPNAIISCKCGVSLKRESLNAHESVCPETQILCRCIITIPRKNMELHEQTDCLEFLVACNLNCGKKIKRREVQSHQLLECYEALIFCNLQCNTQMKRKDLEKHQTSNCWRYKQLIEILNHSIPAQNQLKMKNL